MNLLYTPAGTIEIACDSGDVPDGYHTFDELYRHRCLLWAYICSTSPHAFKTRRNDRGEEMPGWFIAGRNTADGQLTYHLPNAFWDLVRVSEWERNFNYDGHTSDDVADRLEAILRGGA